MANEDRQMVMPVRNESPSKTAAMPVHQDVFDALANLDAALHRRYGCDFAYTVMGRGCLLAASNSRYGVVTPISLSGLYQALK